MLCERSRGGSFPLISSDQDAGALNLAWYGLRQLKRDPFWADHAPEEAQRLHADAWRKKDRIIDRFKNITIAGAGIDATAGARPPARR
jgi:hypothetical protein